MNIGMLIAVEGIDKAGKSTLVDELAKRFVLDGEEVVTIHFPAYDTISGQIITQMLEGTHILRAKNYPYELQALMTINRYEQQRRIEYALMEGKIVICDRYIHSGMVYGLVDGCDRRWLEEIHHSCIKPDVVIYVDISIEEYKRRCKEYDKLDLYESDIEFIERIKKAYQEIKETGYWYEINGEQPVNELAEQAYRYIENYRQEHNEDDET